MTVKIYAIFVAADLTGALKVIEICISNEENFLFSIWIMTKLALRGTELTFKENTSKLSLRFPNFDDFL